MNGSRIDLLKIGAHLLTKQLLLNEDFLYEKIEIYEELSMIYSHKNRHKSYRSDKGTKIYEHSQHNTRWLRARLLAALRCY